MSKTVEELIMVFEKARAEAAPFPQHHEDGLYAGIAAVIMAVRDEMASGTAWHAINAILGDAGNEKVAGSTPEGAVLSSSAEGEPPASPATDPAPAVCVWEVDGRNLWFARCPKQMGHRSYSQPPSHCPACKAPIKFTEAKT